VRKYTAEALYVQMLSDAHAVGPPSDALPDAAAGSSSGDGEGDGDVEERWCGFAATAAQLDGVCDLLVSTAWDGASLADARKRRLDLVDAMGLKMTVKENNTGVRAATAGPRPKADELDSYASLVHLAGY
jgi:hypothetical protein